MSLPLQKAILGDDGWFYGSIFVAVFNIFVWTHGLVSMSGDKKQLSFKKLVLNPGLIGVLLAIILFITGFKLPYIISQPVEYLAVLNTPLPMLIIGFYLSQADFKKAFNWQRAYIFLRPVPSDCFTDDYSGCNVIVPCHTHNYHGLRNRHISPYRRNNNYVCNKVQQGC